MPALDDTLPRETPGTDGSSPLEPGETIGGDYRIVELRGRGGMGAVYVAEHVRLGKRFALKVVEGTAGLNPDSVLRLEREARAASSIDHDHIVDVTHLGQAEDGRLFIVMELLEGKDLREHQEGLRSTSDGGHAYVATPDVVHWVPQLISGLAAAHEAGVVHRDLKPENIFLSRRRGRVSIKLLDFGMSKLRSSDQLRLTRTGQIVGTPLYMSPEQARGAQDSIDERSDVYAVGVVLYEMLSGDVPFPADTLYECVYKHATQEPSPLAEARPDLPESVCALVHRCLAKSPDDRFENGRELAVAWERAGSDLEKTPSARPPAQITPSPAQITPSPAQITPSPAELTPSPADVAPARAVRSSRALGWLALPLLLAALAGGGWWVWQTSREEVSVTPQPDSQAQTPFNEPEDPASPPDVPDEVLEPEPTEPVPTDAPALEVAVSSNPSRAAVRIAGDLVGHTPVQIVIPEGEESVEILVTRRHYESLRREIGRDDRDGITVRLVPAVELLDL